jgi:hypothetical protein
MTEAIAAERISLLTLWAGIIFVLFAMVAFALDQGPPDTSTARAILAHFADARSAIEWQTLLYGMAGAALLLFASGVAARIRAMDIADGHALAFVLVAAAAGLVVFQLAGQAAWFTLTRQSSADLRQGLQEAWLYHDLAASSSWGVSRSSQSCLRSRWPLGEEHYPHGPGASAGCCCRWSS